MDSAVGADGPVYGPCVPWAPGQGPGKAAPSTPTNKKETQVKEEVDLIVRVPPQEMEGINILWKIAFDCKEVASFVMRLLRQLHTEVDFGPDGREQKELISSYEDQFIESCLKMVQSDMADPKENEGRIEQCLTFVRMIIQNSEKYGTHGLTPHYALLAGNDMCTLTIKNLYNQAEQGARKEFKIKVSHNETVFNLRKLVAAELSKKDKPDAPPSAVPHPM